MVHGPVAKIRGKNRIFTLTLHIAASSAEELRASTTEWPPPIRGFVGATFPATQHAPASRID